MRARVGKMEMWRSKACICSRITALRRMRERDFSFWVSWRTSWYSPCIHRIRGLLGTRTYPTASRSFCPSTKPLSRTRDRFSFSFMDIFFRQLRFFYRASSVTREGGCNLRLLLDLASVIFSGLSSTELMTIFYCLNFETLLIWRAKFPCIFFQEHGCPVILPLITFALYTIYAELLSVQHHDIMLWSVKYGGYNCSLVIWPPPNSSLVYFLYWT
jgi:hypothetical protein